MKRMTLALLRRLATSCEDPDELLATLTERADELGALFGVSPAALVERATACARPELPLRLVEAVERRVGQLSEASATARESAYDAAAARCVTHVGDGEVEVDLGDLCEACKGVDLVGFEDARGDQVLVVASRIKALGALKRACSVTVDATGLHARWSATGGLNLAPQTLTLPRGHRLTQREKELARRSVRLVHVQAATVQAALAA